MEKIFLFIAFLVTYVLYLWITIKLFSKFVSRVKKDSFIENEILIIIPTVFLFASVFIIGKFVNWYLLGLTLILSQLGVLITGVAWGLLGSPKVPFKAVSGWAGANFALSNKWIIIATQVLSILIILAYPIVIAIYYFSSHSIDDIRLFALRVTLILILSSYIALLPILIAVFTADYIDEDSRARYLITQVSTLFSLSLFVSLLFWTYNIGSTTQRQSLGGLTLVFNPLLFTILTGFFLLFLLLPYAIGVQAAKQLKKDNLKTEKEILESIAETIQLSDQQTVSTALGNIKNTIVQKFQNLQQTNEGVKLGLRYENVEDPQKELVPSEILVFNYFKEAKSFDLHFLFYNFLNDTYLAIESLINTFNAQTTPAAYETVATKYAKYYKDKVEDLEKQSEKNSSSKPGLWIALIALLSPLASQFMTEAGKYVVTMFKQII